MGRGQSSGRGVVPERRDRVVVILGLQGVEFLFVGVIGVALAGAEMRGQEIVAAQFLIVRIEVGAGAGKYDQAAALLDVMRQRRDERRIDLVDVEQINRVVIVERGAAELRRGDRRCLDEILATSADATGASALRTKKSSMSAGVVAAAIDQQDFHFADGPHGQRALVIGGEAIMGNLRGDGVVTLRAEFGEKGDRVRRSRAECSR